MVNSTGLPRSMGVDAPIDQRCLTSELEGTPMLLQTGSDTAWRRWISMVIGTAITIIFVWLIVRRLSFDELVQAFAAMDLHFLPFAVVSLAIGYTARITRWWVMLRVGAPLLAWPHTARIFLMSITANNLLPLRAGDIFRLFAFRGQPGLETSRVGGTLIVERLLDLVTLLLIFIFVLPFVPAGRSTGQLTTLATWGAGLAVAALIGLLALPSLESRVLRRLIETPWIRSSPMMSRPLAAASTLVDAITRLWTPRRLAAIVLLSVLIWTFEGGVFVVALVASRVPASLLAAFFALAAATLGTLFPSSPGYIGTFDFFAMQAVSVFGALAGTAALFAITTHLLLWLPTTVAGFVCFLWLVVFDHDSKIILHPRKDPRRKRPPNYQCLKVHRMWP